MALLPQPQVGGSLSLDLMNTVWQHDGKPFDWLTDDAAVHDFTERHGQPIDADDVAATRDALVETRSLIGRVLAAPTDAASWGVEVDQVLRSTVVSFDAATVAVKIVGTPPPREIATAALLDVLHLLSDRPDRIRSCDSHDCTLWFLDTSKAGRRRWCSMETCGNRAKARRHHAKTTEANEQ